MPILHLVAFVACSSLNFTFTLPFNYVENKNHLPIA